MATQTKIIPGTMIVRESGGTPGTDEVQLSHNGTNAIINAASGRTLVNGSGLTVNGSLVVTGSTTLATSLSGVLQATAGVISGGAGLNSLAGVAITGAADGDLLIHNGTNWVDVAGNSETARAYLGLGTGATVTFESLILGTDLTVDEIQSSVNGTVALFTDGTEGDITIGNLDRGVIIAGDLTVNGTTTTINSTSLEVADADIIVNNGGNLASSAGAGILVEVDGTTGGYYRVAADTGNLEIKATNGSTLTLDINANTTLTMSAPLNVSGTSAINQSVLTTAAPTFAALTLDGTVENTISHSLKVGNPTAGDYDGTAGQINAEAIFINGTAVSAGGGVSELNDLTDVSLAAETLGDLFVYDGSDWINLAVGSASGVQAWDVDLDTIAGLTHTLGNVIRSNGTVWQSTTLAFNDLGDVVITTPTLGHIVFYDGTNWINGAPTNAGVQPYDSDLATIAGLTPADGNFIVGDGTAWTTESGDVARTSLGLGSGDSPTFTGVTIGDVAENAVSRTYVLRNETTDDTQTELFLDGTSVQLVLADDSTWAFNITVVGRRTDADNEGAAYRFEGAIDQNDGTTLLIGDPEITNAEDDADWEVVVDADDANSALRIQVTGETGKDIKWVAFVRTVEVIG